MVKTDPVLFEPRTEVFRVASAHADRCSPADVIAKSVASRTRTMPKFGKRAL